MKANIVELSEAVETSKQKQKEAKDEIKKLEKDMDEFKNNKEGKITELKACSLLTPLLVLIVLTTCTGQYLKVEGGSSQAFRRRQDAKQRPSGCFS